MSSSVIIFLNTERGKIKRSGERQNNSCPQTLASTLYCKHTRSHGAHYTGGDAIGSTQTWHHIMETTKTPAQRLPPLPFVFLCTMEDIYDIDGGCGLWRRCAAHAVTKLDSYPVAGSKYAMVKEQFTKNIHHADGNKSPKSNKNTHVTQLVRAPQLSLRFKHLCRSLLATTFPFVFIHPALHCYDRSVNIDIISLHCDDSPSCRKPLISSVCACMCASAFVVVCRRARPRWLPGQKALA